MFVSPFGKNLIKTKLEGLAVKGPLTYFDSEVPHVDARLQDPSLDTAVRKESEGFGGFLRKGN